MKESQALVEHQEATVSGKQQASLLLASHPREARCGRGSRDGLRAQRWHWDKLSLRGRWGEAPAGHLVVSWMHPAVRAAPGKGRSCAQGVRAEGPRALLEDGQGKSSRRVSLPLSAGDRPDVPPWASGGSRTVVGAACSPTQGLRGSSGPPGSFRSTWTTEGRAHLCLGAAASKGAT